MLTILDLVGDVAFAGSALTATLFAVLYATRSRWRSTPAGRVTLGVMTVIAAILLSAILFGTVWRDGHDLDRTAVRAVLYTLLFGGLVHYTVLLLRAQAADRRRARHRTPAQSPQKTHSQIGRPSMRPALGEIVHYRGKQGLLASRAAIVTATRDSLDPRGVESGEVPALDSPEHVHLWVFTPGEKGGFPEFNVPHGEAAGESATAGTIPPGTWCWPPRIQ